MAALGDLHRRHEALHARYRRTDPPVAMIPPNPGMPQLRLLTDAATEQEALDQLAEAVQQPLDYTQGRNWRAALIRDKSTGRVLFGVRHPPHRLRRLVVRAAGAGPEPRLRGAVVGDDPESGRGPRRHCASRTTSTPACATPPTWRRQRAYWRERAARPAPTGPGPATGAAGAGAGLGCRRPGTPSPSPPRSCSAGTGPPGNSGSAAPATSSRHSPRRCAPSISRTTSAC